MNATARAAWWRRRSRGNTPGPHTALRAGLVFGGCGCSKESTPSARTVIKLDGSQHYEQETRIRYEERDAAPERIGNLVLRYSNSDISLRFRDVYDDILLHIHEHTQIPQISEE